jgi:PAS domain S-box-containing protein
VRKSDRSIEDIIMVIEDISARKHAQEELHQSEKQFRSLLLASPLPALLFDDRGQVLAISESWLEETGYSRDELRRLEDWTTRAYQERSNEVLKYLWGLISHEPQWTLCEERTIRTKDGRERLWRFFGAAVGTQSDGRRVFVCIAYDVSDRSNAYENQILLLLRESNHRAKNMLSLVQAIARQTAARQPEDFIERFNERIRAHPVRTCWSGASGREVMSRT